MFEWDIPHLQPERATRETKQRRGLIPVDIDLDKSRLVWMDVGDHHLSESFFFVSTEMLRRDKADSHAFTSDFSVLDSDDILAEFVYPTGFMFHMGRCGSTLLSKALARSPYHVVISEAPPHFHSWSVFTDDWTSPLAQTETNLRRYRNLILSTGRKRRDEYRAHFVKFTTFNILFLDFIRAAFPDVPALFMYRDPAEVMVSLAAQGPGWQHLKDTSFGAVVAGCSVDEVKSLSLQSFHEHFLHQFMSAAVQAPPDKFSLLNYNQLQPEMLAAILQKDFGYSATASDLARMQEQFRFHAKVDDTQAQFVPDSVGKQRRITPEIEALVASRLMPLYERLEQAGNNLSR